MSTRLDVLLIQRGFAPSRKRAKELIVQGQVNLGGRQVLKPGLMVPLNAEISIEGQLLPYPSRAGLKLEKALDVFRIDVSGSVALDIGASTGGFTSCLLQRGARKVFAVDVGQGQLDSELRDDPRVVNLERTNIRDLTLSQLGQGVDVVTIDVSFISLRLVFPVLPELIKADAQIIALIKPQFETGGVGLNKHGVITDSKIHFQFIPSLIGELEKFGFNLLNFDLSPISGSKGNREYLAHFRKDSRNIDWLQKVETIIKGAWQN